MKKFISFVMALVMMASVTAAYAYQAPEVSFEEMVAHVTGADKEDLDVTAYKKVETFESGYVKETVLLPLREVCEYYGMTVTWKGGGEKQWVFVSRKDFDVVYGFSIGGYNCVIDGKTYIPYRIIPCNADSVSDNYFSFSTTENPYSSLIVP